jgi:hypothetical protein
MLKRLSWIIVALVIVGATAAVAQVHVAQPPRDRERIELAVQKTQYYPPNSKPFGRTYREWSADWWRWALSIPPAYMPIIDPTGDSCAVGQHGPVWFLSGTFGETVVRHCAVPGGRALFFPLINCEWENIWVGQPILPINELYALCAPASIPVLTLEVDGVPLLPSEAVDPDDASLLDFRATADVFDYSLPLDNIAGQPQGVYYPAISDGWWMMLKPLAPGSHTLRFTASNDSGFYLDVTYELDVIALEGICASPPCP